MDRRPDRTHTIRPSPTEPELFRTPFGDTNIPAPIIIPTIIATPSKSPNSFFSLMSLFGRNVSFPAANSLFFLTDIVTKLSWVVCLMHFFYGSFIILSTVSFWRYFDDVFKLYDSIGKHNFHLLSLITYINKQQFHRVLFNFQHTNNVHEILTETIRSKVINICWNTCSK